MSEAPGLEAEGTKLLRGDGEEPEDFNEIGAVTSITGIGGGSPTILNPTRLGDDFQRKRVGLRDEGQASLTLQWDGSDAEFQGMHEDRVNKTLRNFELEYPDGTQIDFAAYVLTFEISSEADSLIEVSCTLEIDGAIEVTWPS